MNEPLPAIRADLDADPGRFAALSDTDAAASYAAGTISIQRDVPAAELLLWAAPRPLWSILDGQTTGTTGQIKSVCAAADLLLTRPDDYALDPNNPDHLELVDVLQTAGILTAQERTSLVALGVHDVREDVGKFSVKTTAGMIGRARAI